jgi:hypothetical protein
VVHFAPQICCIRFIPLIKLVRFAPQIHVRVIPLTGPSLRKSLWYQKTEIASLRRRDKLILSWRALGMENHPILLLRACSEEWSARGLENQSLEGSFLRKQHKLHGVLAVLLEQKRQLRESSCLSSLDYSDGQDLIAARYKRSSKECQDAAHKQGLMDEEEARALHEDWGTNSSSGVTFKESHENTHYAQTSRTSRLSKYLKVAPSAA